MEQVAYQNIVAGIEVLLMAILTWAGTKAFFMGLRTTGVLVACGATLSLAGAAGTFLVPAQPASDAGSPILMTFSTAGLFLLAIGILRLVLVMDSREDTSDPPP
jgi:hypothetical protein